MNELVNVYVETKNGWELLFENIPEDIALEIWRAGFKTGENRFSIESEKYKRLWEKLNK